MSRATAYAGVMATIFTKIIAREIPGTFVWEDERCAAFLSINPLRPGHTLVVPREEIDHWLDCPPDLRDHLMAVAGKVGSAIEAAWNPEKVGLMIAGLEVPHMHIHVVPIWGPNDLDFSNAASAVASDELAKAAALIIAHL